MANEWQEVELSASGKRVMIPAEMFNVGDTITMKQYAYESGQATKEEAGISNEYKPVVSDPIMAALIGAGRTVSDLGSNIRQAGAEAFGSSIDADDAKRDQLQSEQLSRSVRDDFPVSSFAGSVLPYFAVPGGKAVQAGFGAAEGALQGDTVGERLFGAGVGLTAAIGGQKAGDWLGARLQNRIQSAVGNPNAAARNELLKSGVPLSLSQRTDGAISKPLTTFFERGKFIWSGRQPQGAAQQAKMTELITDALGVKGGKLTRAVLGDAVASNKSVFRGAAHRVGDNIKADSTIEREAFRIMRNFDEVGTDSPQVQKIFDRYIDFVTDGNGFDPDKFLRLRSDLSAATRNTRSETGAVVDAITSMDDHLARLVPELADDLAIARDRFRLLLAIRRGSALSPQGDINVPTLTKSLERVFTDFDANVPLPGALRDTGETIAALNQVAVPLRSSGTTENALAAGLPGAGALDPNLVLRAALGLAAPFAGGGTGGLIGGGTGRSISNSLLGEAIGQQE